MKYTRKIASFSIANDSWNSLIFWKLVETLVNVTCKIHEDFLYDVSNQDKKAVTSVDQWISKLAWISQEILKEITVAFHILEVSLMIVVIWV